MNAGRKRRAIASIVVSLDSVRTDTGGAIEVDGDERGATVGVRDCHPRPERHENMTIARHDHWIAISLKDGPQPQGEITRLIFLGNSLTGNAAAVEAAVTGINHNRRSRAGLARSQRGERHETHNRHDGNG